MTAQNEATLAQVFAADPSRSTWLTANAGSGKTRVLTDRVARLLFAGTDPESILCLTYTKAAASEMQNRLFQRLGQWTMLDRDTLCAELVELGEGPTFTDEQLDNARTLFAKAIEARGGLKIQTIHSFCSSLLRQFPLEAGVSPMFVEIDDIEQRKLRQSILSDMATDPAGAATVQALLSIVSEYDIEKLISEICQTKEGFTDPISADAVWAAFDLPPGFSSDQIMKDTIRPGDAAMVSEVARFLSTKEKTDFSNGQKLINLDLTVFSHATFEVLESVFVYKEGQKPGLPKTDRFPTKPSQKELNAVLPELHALMSRVAENKDRRLALLAAQNTKILHDFGHRFVTHFENYKSARRLLDFDDLIKKTKALLQKPGAAEWVLYKLDGRLDHILVDEAQDTSPDQWDIITLLTNEVLAGTGARPEDNRTLFVVGDKKQSIYSFQGADPMGFERMAESFEKRTKALDQSFERTQLSYSFRSSEAIMAFVDRVFENQTGLLETPKHISFKSTLPGRVDVWPLIEKGQDSEKPHWTSPVDEISPDHPDKILASNIADRIVEMIANEKLPVQDRHGNTTLRPIRPSDFLILLRGRTTNLYDELHRACKDRKIPMAGADRILVKNEMAVRDLISLFKFLSTPEDSLSLAEALRSPLFGWSEKDLFDLAHGRTDRYLWRSLQNQRDIYPKTVSMLEDLRNRSEFLRPYELLETVLIHYQGRQNLLARLGLEAEEAIDALLAQTLNFETQNTPSLMGFIKWFCSEDIEHKRQLDGGRDELRIMTIHGAKGLEAPIVIIPDTKPPKETVKDRILPLGGLPVLNPKAGETPFVLEPSLIKERNTARQERERLLYVALTRAENWLIIAGTKGQATKADDWYKRLSDAVDDFDPTTLLWNDLEIRRFENGRFDGHACATEPDQIANRGRDDFKTYAVVEKTADAPKPISPSDMGGAKTVPGPHSDPDLDPLEHGTMVHALLENLPQHHVERWPNVARTIVGEHLSPAALDEALSVLNGAELQWIFAKDALAEVPISGTSTVLPDQKVFGYIDRMLITETKVTVIDFKTNRVVPTNPNDVPESILRQMGAYDDLLRQIYPKHELEMGILWTANASYMRIPHHIVKEALQRYAHS